MLCKKCGAQIPDNSVECEFCGANLTEEIKPTLPEEFDGDETASDFDDVQQTADKEQIKDEDIFDDNERRRRKQMQKMMEDKKQQLSEIERRRDEKRQRQKRNRILLIALICVAAIAAAGFGAYYIAKSINPTPSVDETPIPTIQAQETIEPIPTTEAEAAATPALSMENEAVTTQTGESGTSASSSGASSDNSGKSWSATGNSGSASSSSSSTAKSSTASSSSTQASGSSSTSKGSTASSSASSSSGNTSSGSSASVTNSGASTNNISAQLVTGGEVIYNNGTGRYLMTFVADNKRYYANVSAGSTTEQIKNKSFTVTAAPTSETYNGNTVYNITTLTGYSGDYILENSGTKLLTSDDIKGLSKYDLSLARNEIYARHGRKFQTEEFNQYFSAKSWYQINPNYNYSDDESNLNEIERKNVNFILDAERK